MKIIFNMTMKEAVEEALATEDDSGIIIDLTNTKTVLMFGNISNILGKAMEAVVNNSSEETEEIDIETPNELLSLDISKAIVVAGSNKAKAKAKSKQKSTPTQRAEKTKKEKRLTGTVFSETHEGEDGLPITEMFTYYDNKFAPYVGKTISVSGSLYKIELIVYIEKTIYKCKIVPKTY